MKGLFWFPNIFLKMFQVLLCILFFSNCASTPTPSYFDDKDYKFDEIPEINIIDPLPDGIKKGYVEFHGKDPSLSISPPISLVGIEVKTYGALDRPLSGPCSNPNITCFIMKVNATNNFLPENISPASVDYLIRALEDPYWGNRAYAAEALGNLEDRRAIDPLITVIINKKEENNVRIQSIEAAEKIGDPKAIEPLNALKRDNDKIIRQTAKMALKKVRKNL